VNTIICRGRGWEACWQRKGFLCRWEKPWGGGAGSRRGKEQDTSSRTTVEKNGGKIKGRTLCLPRGRGTAFWGKIVGRGRPETVGNRRTSVDSRKKLEGRWGGRGVVSLKFREQRDRRGWKWRTSTSAPGGTQGVVERGKEIAESVRSRRSRFSHLTERKLPLGDGEWPRHPHKIRGYAA